MQNVRQAYLAGDLTQTQAILEKIAGENMAPEERLQARLQLAALCEENSDFACFKTNATEMMKLAELFPAALRSAAVTEIQPWIIRMAIWAKQSEEAHVGELIKKWNNLPDDALSPRSYLALQQCAFLYAVDGNDKINARIAISRLLSKAITLPDDPEMMARYLAAAIGNFRVLHDDYNALRYFLGFDDFIKATLPRRNPVFAAYLEASATLQADRGSTASRTDAIARITSAAAIMRDMKGPEASKIVALTQIAIETTLFQILYGDLKAARAAHQDNPLQRRRTALQAQAGFEKLEEVYFVILDIYLASLEQRLPDVRWQTILLKSDIGKLGLKHFEPIEAYRQFGAALLAGSQSRYWKPLLLSAATGDIGQYEENLLASTRAFPFPTYIDREIVGLALTQIASDTNRDALRADIAIKGTGFLQRNIRSKRGDDLYRIALSGSEAERRRMHAWIFVSEAHRDMEFHALKTRVALLARGLPAEKAMAGFRETVVRLGNDQTRILESRPSKVQGQLPRLAEIQPLLSDGEAFIAEAAHGGTIFKLCVTRKGWHFLSEPIPERIPGDLKILRAALSAGHAPSPVLDAQYPAAASIAVQKLALGGLEPCLGKGRKIIFSAAGFMADIPLTALLESIPPRAGDGFDLSKATWLLNKYEFSYVTSAEEFVAVRRMAQEPGNSDQEFLGIGDPVLAAKPAGALGQPERAAHLSRLKELPETGIELKEIAGQFDRAKILTRDKATEEDFRQARPDRFEIIEFATHGLMGGEIDGISEPGLVLTPNSTSTEPRDDGFLSTTEIAALSLNARLVVLSACNTANFQLDEYTSSIRGLTASFALAGVPTVIASLWPVESDTSQKLMSGFFKELKTGKDKSVTAAMTASMRSFLADPPSKAFLHPRFWAPFSVYGDGNSQAVFTRRHPSH